MPALNKNLNSTSEIKRFRFRYPVEKDNDKQLGPDYQ